MTHKSPSLIAPLAVVVAITAFMGFALINLGQTSDAQISHANSAAVSQTDTPRG